MVRAAFANSEDRIAPVFDTARELYLVESESGRILSETKEVLSGTQPIQKVSRLVELGAKTLVCGAISRPVHAMVTAYGIRVFPFVAGTLPEVVHAWLDAKLDEGTFSMPGCFGRRRGWLDEKNFYRENLTMNGQGNSGGGMGAGRGQGRGGGQGRNRGGGMGRGMQPGASDICVCSQCGHRETHKRGVPCNRMKCPECGSAMVRE